jgi:DNA adenine methylase
MKNDKLNMMSYYGGKAKMSSFIADMLDYRNSKIYIELFGGAGSVILNKTPHDIEIYNEYNLGVYTLFSVVKNKEMLFDLIDRLFRNSEYSKDCFSDALRYRNSIEDNPLKESTRLLYEYIKGIQNKYELDWFSYYKKAKGKNDLLKDNL